MVEGDVRFRAILLFVHCNWRGWIRSQFYLRKAIRVSGVSGALLGLIGVLLAASNWTEISAAQVLRSSLIRWVITFLSWVSL